MEDLSPPRPGPPCLILWTPPSVAPGTDQEIAAWETARRGESALAVVDGEGRFVGFIPPHRLIEVLLTEHEEDLDRLGLPERHVRGAKREPADTPVPDGCPGCWSAWRARCSPPTWWARSRSSSGDGGAGLLRPRHRLPGGRVGTQTETVAVRGLLGRRGLEADVQARAPLGLLAGLAPSGSCLPLRPLALGDAEGERRLHLALRGLLRRHQVLAIGAALDAASPRERSGVRQRAPGHRNHRTCSIVIYFAVWLLLIG